MMVRRSVDLPTPFLPSTARLPGSRTANDTPSSTIAGREPARTLSSARSGSAMARLLHGFARRLAEINRAHLRIGCDLMRRAFDQDAAADHHDHARGKAKDEFHVVLDE